MLLIFCRTFANHMGGLQIFNQELENLLKENKILFKTIPAPIWSEQLSILNYVARVYNTWKYCLTKRNQSISILVQYGGFWDICFLPLLALTSRKIFVIAHVGKQWKHLKSPFFKKLTQFILKRFAYRLLLLSDAQTNIFHHPTSIKIHTIINKAYLNPTKKSKRRKGNYLLYLGRVCDEKGISDLIQSYSVVKTSEKDFPPLRIVGPGDEC